MIKYFYFYLDQHIKPTYVDSILTTTGTSTESFNYHKLEDEQMQQLQVNLTIPIPEGYVLITKVEYEELQQEKLRGHYWSMEDLEKRTGKKRLWLKTNLLFIPRFKEELEKFVHYPIAQEDEWSFHATKMVNFLDENFHLIFGGSK